MHSRSYKIMFILIFIILTGTASWFKIVLTQKTSKQTCYEYNKENVATRNKNITMLEDILEATRKPTLGKTIFFHETSCSPNGLIHLDTR